MTIRNPNAQPLKVNPPPHSRCPPKQSGLHRSRPALKLLGLGVVATILVLLAGSGAAYADMANNVEFSPVFNAARGLEIQVQNYSKLPRSVTGVDVLLGGSSDRAACRVTVPGVTLAPAARATVLVADLPTVNGCLPKGSPTRTTARLVGLDNLPSKTGEASAAPVPFERAVRIMPRFSGDSGAAPHELRFRLAN